MAKFERATYHRDPEWFYPDPETRGDRWVFIVAVVIFAIWMLAGWL